MDNQEAIETIKLALSQIEWEYPMDYAVAFDMAISALQEKDSRRICETCKHTPPSKKWPCVDCDMREPSDRWEPQEERHSTKSSLTQKGLDTISRQAAIDVIRNWKIYETTEGLADRINKLPSAQLEIIHCKDCKYFGVDRYKKLTWCSRINYGYGYQADDFCSKAERRTDEPDK